MISELGWPDDWQRLGDGIWVDLEPLKTGHPPEAYAPDLPASLARHQRG